MAEPLPPLHDPERPDAWAVAYVDGTMSEADRASFAAHLQSHEACRAMVETLRLAFPAFDRVLMEDGPPRTGAEMLAIGRAAEARIAARALPSTSLAANEDAPAPHLASPAPGERGELSQPASLGKSRLGSPIWAWSAGFAALAAAAASVLLFLQPFSAGVEPELLGRAESVPIVDSGPRPLPPWPTKLAVSAEIRFGKLELAAPRLPTDVYTAVALIDAKNHPWLARPGDHLDPSCTPDCGPLKLRVALDRLPPGAFRVMVMVSSQPITEAGVRQWLPQADQVAPRWLGVRAYAVTRVTRAP